MMAPTKFELLSELEEELFETELEGEALGLEPLFTRTSLGESGRRGDCSGWERDPESFCVFIAKYHIRRELGRALQVQRVIRLPSGCYVYFPNGIAVYVSLSRVPDFVAAKRMYPEPAGRSCFYTYFCTPEGQPVLSECKLKPP